MYIILDESGDLGWTFDRPNRYGGSSRFFTIAHFCCPKKESKQIERFIKGIHDKFHLNPVIEKKGCSFSDTDSKKICIEFLKLLNKFPGFRFGTITVSKVNVAARLQEDENILYNYATYQLLHELICKFQHLHFVPDKRSIKVRRASSMIDYIITKLITEHDSVIKIDYDPQNSEHNRDLWLADWLANFVWRHYEDGRSDAFNELVKSPQFFHKELYFK